MIRVGFLLNVAGAGWLGGASYYRNLFAALADLPQRRIAPVLVAPTGGRQALASQFPGAEVIGLPLLDAPVLVAQSRRVMRLVSGRDLLMERALRAVGIDIVSHSLYLGWRATLPSIVWIPDFQELSYPEFFSRRELAARRRNAVNCSRHASTILLSSESALADLRSMGLADVPTEVLRFVASVPAPAELLSRAEVAGRYGISRAYFHLPNQFWIHKNHRIVLEALAWLRAQGRDVEVIATGNLADPRQPGHVPALMATARELGIDDLFRPLGVVPYIDLMSLMRHAVAVINPSKFEGWSTTVEEAKSMGKPILLSDLHVHREQDPSRAAFFAPDDAKQLAKEMAEMADQWDAESDDEFVQDAAQRLPSRREAFARRYEEIVLATMLRHAAGRRSDALPAVKSADR